MAFLEISSIRFHLFPFLYRLLAEEFLGEHCDEDTFDNETRYRLNRSHPNLWSIRCKEFIENAPMKGSNAFEKRLEQGQMRGMIYSNDEIRSRTKRDNQQIGYDNTPHVIAVSCEKSQEQGEKPAPKFTLHPSYLPLKPLSTIGKASCYFIKSLFPQLHSKFSIGSHCFVQSYKSEISVSLLFHILFISQCNHLRPIYVCEINSTPTNSEYLSRSFSWAKSTKATCGIKKCILQVRSIQIGPSQS